MHHVSVSYARIQVVLIFLCMFVRIAGHLDEEHTTRSGGVVVVVVVVVVINWHNQVRGHRTGSSHSGVEEYPNNKTHGNKSGTRKYRG